MHRARPVVLRGYWRSVRGAILHTNDMRADLLALDDHPLSSRAWIAHVHGWLRQTHSGKHKIYENIDRYLIRGADLVLVGSSAMAEEVRPGWRSTREDCHQRHPGL